MYTVKKKRAEILLYFTSLVVAQISAVEDLEQIQSCQRFPNKPFAAWSFWLFILKAEYSVLLTELDGPDLVHLIHNIGGDLTGVLLYFGCRCCLGGGIITCPWQCWLFHVNREEKHYISSSYRSLCRPEIHGFNAHESDRALIFMASCYLSKDRYLMMLGMLV